MRVSVFFFQREDGIRELGRYRGLGDVYKRQEGIEGLPPVTDQVDHIVYATPVVGCG